MMLHVCEALSLNVILLYNNQSLRPFPTPSKHNFVHACNNHSENRWKRQTIAIPCMHDCVLVPIHIFVNCNHCKDKNSILWIVKAEGKRLTQCHVISTCRKNSRYHTRYLQLLLKSNSHVHLSSLDIATCIIVNKFVHFWWSSFWVVTNI